MNSIVMLIFIQIFHSVAQRCDMGTSHMIRVGFTCVLFYQLVEYVKGEYCPAHYDYDHVLQPGFYCPSSVRLVGISDFYCCHNNRISNAVYCCNDRTKSVNFSNQSFGDEWIIVNWPILMVLGMLFGIIVIISYTTPRAAEMKENQIEDV